MTAGDFDLDGYLARIGWAGPLAPDLATLRRLVAHHTAAISFEGVDALLGRTPAVDAAGLQAKLVGARRGGWCFEQNRCWPWRSARSASGRGRCWRG